MSKRNIGVPAPWVDIFFFIFITGIGDGMMGLYRTHIWVNIDLHEFLLRQRLEVT